MSLTQQEPGAKAALEASVSEELPATHLEEEQQQLQAAGPQQADAAEAHPESSSSQAAGGALQETDTESREAMEAEQQEAERGGGGESDGEEGKGMKRKREELHTDEEAGQSSEKKKVQISLFWIPGPQLITYMFYDTCFLSLSAPQLDDDTMASMLADFIACPPDDEDGASGSNAS